VFQLDRLTAVSSLTGVRQVPYECGVVAYAKRGDDGDTPVPHSPVLFVLRVPRALCGDLRTRLQESGTLGQRNRGHEHGVRVGLSEGKGVATVPRREAVKQTLKPSE